MSKINTPDSEADPFESDEQYELIARRRFDRRDADNTTGSEIKNIQPEESKQQDRRQCERRSSRPALLSIDEIAKLRKTK